MNIALVVPGGVDRSGTERVTPALLWQIERLSRRHKLHVFALRQDTEPGEWFLHSTPVHSIGTRAGRRRRLLVSFAKHHADQRFDVIHAFGGGPGVYAAFLARVHRRPLVLQLTGGELASLPDIEYGSWRTRRGRMALRFAARSARVITVASEPMRRLAESRGIPAEIVPLGVALDAWPPRSPVARHPGSHARLLHVADLNRVKDHHTMLAAARRLRDAGVNFRLDFAGVDTLEGTIQRAARDMGLGNLVKWHGHVDRKSLRNLFENSDLLVLTSRHEAGPLAVLEAAIAGVPTVGTAVGHIAEWAPHAAVAVPCRDALALSSAISSLLENESQRIAMASEAQSWAIQHDADYTAGRYEQLYQFTLS